MFQTARERKVKIPPKRHALQESKEKTDYSRKGCLPAAYPTLLASRLTQPEK